MLVKLGDLIEEYSERNTDNKYKPVAVGKYGIRTRESIYSKELAKDYSKNKLIYKGTLTVGMGSNQIDIGILREDGTYSVSPAYHTYRINIKNYDYLDYLLAANNSRMFSIYANRGSRQGKTLDLKRWLTDELKIHDEIDQALIVQSLNKIKLLISQKEDELAKLDNLIKARFVEMFGNVVVNDKSWPTKPISNVVPASSPKITVSENIWLLNLDMIESQSGKVLDRLIVSKNKINASTCAFDDKNVLYSKLRPYLNKVVLPDQEGYCTTELVPLRPSNELNREFLATLLRSDAFVGYINEKTAGAKMPRVSMNIFRQFECILPPITLQEQFSAFYKQVDKSKFTLSNELAMCNFYVRLINDSITHSRIDLRMSE